MAAHMLEWARRFAALLFAISAALVPPSAPGDDWWALLHAAPDWTPPCRALSQASVYVTPHQDDEVISLAGGITTDVAAHCDVYLVVMNRGDYSNVGRRLCNEGRACPTPAELQASREAEALESTAALGIPADHVTFERVDESAAGYPDQVDAAWTRIVARFGQRAIYNSISWLDRHPGHVSIAYALKYRCEAGTVQVCRFFQSPLYRPGSPLKHAMPVAPPTPMWLSAPPDAVRRATAAYARWDPGQGRLAVGEASVPDQLAYARTWPGSLVHPDGRSWTPDAHAAALDWLAHNQSLDDAVFTSVGRVLG